MVPILSRYRTAGTDGILPKRWTKLRQHVEQQLYWRSEHRFNVVPAGRRSGKTEIAKRRLVRKAIRGTAHDRPMFFYAAPTYNQAKRIAWEDLKRLVPKKYVKGRISEGDLYIPLWHGGGIYVLGLDKPERIEGSPWDHGVLDEYGNTKAEAWGQNVRPALSDRMGSCDLIGVPEGRNHYYDLALLAQAEMMARGLESEYGYFHWVSADILPAKEIEQAKRDLDLLTFQQEYEASFVNFEGRAYHAFTDKNKFPCKARYNPRQPLIIMMDFNVAPGVAAVGQELPNEKGAVVTQILGEVYIENNSDTVKVCRRLLLDWGIHGGRVEVYGDSTGGAKGSAQVQGSDWDLAKKALREGLENLPGFRDRVFFFIKSKNPPERSRVNAVNSRTCAINGDIRLLVDPTHAPHVVKDLEGVRLVKGGSGEIDKAADLRLTHISDAVGYYIEYKYPVSDSWKPVKFIT